METLVLSQIAMTAGRRQRISDGRVLATAALLAAMAVAGAGHAAGDMDDQAETDADAGIHSDEAEADLSDGALLSDRLAHRWIPSASFFTMGGVAMTNGTPMSPDAIKEQIRQIVAASCRPLSDAAIAKHLIALSIPLSRRCVNKYRHQMGLKLCRSPRAARRRLVEC